MMQGCGNEIFSIFNRFHRLKISSILPGVSSVEMGTLKTIEHCRKEKEMATKETDAKEPDSKRLAETLQIHTTLQKLLEGELV